MMLSSPRPSAAGGGGGGEAAAAAVAAGDASGESSYAPPPIRVANNAHARGGAATDATAAAAAAVHYHHPIDIMEDVVTIDDDDDDTIIEDHYGDSCCDTSNKKIPSVATAATSSSTVSPPSPSMTMNELRFQYAVSLSERATEILLDVPQQPSTTTSTTTSCYRNLAAGRTDEMAIEAFKEALCVLKDLMLDLDGSGVGGGVGGEEDIAIVEDDDDDYDNDHGGDDGDGVRSTDHAIDRDVDSIDDSIDLDNDDDGDDDDDTVLVPHQHGYNSSNSDDVIMVDASATHVVVPPPPPPPTNTTSNDAFHSSRTIPVRMFTYPLRQPTVSASSASTTEAAAAAAAAAAAGGDSNDPTNKGGSLDTSGEIYIYKNLVRFCPSGNIKVDTNILSATIIFNMALLYHHHGIVSQQCNTTGCDCCGSSNQHSPPLFPANRRIQESDLSSLYGLCLQLYDMAVILVERVLSSQEHQRQRRQRQRRQDNHADDESDCCEWECLFLRMICLNNMAQAAYENREYVQSRHLLDVLQVSMREDEAVSKIFLDESSIHGIILNCILLHPPSAAEAA